MADDDKDGVECALTKLVGVTGKSGMLRNDVRKDILEAVSSPRNYFVQVQSEMKTKTAAHEELGIESKESREEVKGLRGAECSKM